MLVRGDHIAVIALFDRNAQSLAARAKMCQTFPDRRSGQIKEDHVADLSSISREVDLVVGRFESLSAVRDRAIGEARQVVRLAANSIRATHRNEIAAAGDLLATARARYTALITPLRPFPALYWAGYVQDAAKELAEAAITYAAVAGEPLPGPALLEVEDAAYLNGLAEAGSELRRDVLDRLRAGELAAAETLLATMDEIYGALVTVDFPDSITGGLRRTTDAFRAVLERTRGDLTMAVTQARVEVALRRATDPRSPVL